MDLYRPMGIEWYTNGFWRLTEWEATAVQFLSVYQTEIAGPEYYVNNVESYSNNIYNIWDVGKESTHKAIGFDAFKSMKFDYVIASVPQHVPLYRELIRQFQPDAKLIVQMGNNWDLSLIDECNVLASLKPSTMFNNNAIFYHQEFDTNIFKPIDDYGFGRVTSYINCLDQNGGWSDFIRLENQLLDIAQFRSLGGQCRDGFVGGPSEVASSVQKNDFVFQVKSGGDGYGHSLYNAYACGKPVIIRSSYYRGCLGEELFNVDNCIDLDRFSLEQAASVIRELVLDKDRLKEMSVNAYRSFVNCVNFDEDAARIKSWLESL